jgi:hypothetical protein
MPAACEKNPSQRVSDLTPDQGEISRPPIVAFSSNRA